MSARDDVRAFPERSDGGYDRPGMTLRDWFAGQALAGLTANERGILDEKDAANLAPGCYKLADAMLAERDR